MTIDAERDANPAALGGCRIAILGYGGQGRAHARNLRDSGFDVIVGARSGGAGERHARADGFRVESPGDAAGQAELVALLVPFMAHRELYERDVAPRLKRGASLLVAHGFSIHYREIEPRHDIDVVLVAPQGPGDLVRAEYEKGGGLPCLFAVRQDATGSARARALAYVWGIGGTAGGAIETSFAEQAETDLFAGQAVRGEGAGELAAMAFDILVEAGYQPEVARFACLARARHFPDMLIGQRQGGEAIRADLAEILKAVQRGAFAGDRIVRRGSEEPRTARPGARPPDGNWIKARPETKAA